MKEVGRLKAPVKSWSLTKDTATGHYQVGYADESVTVHGNPSEMNLQIQVAKDYIAIEGAPVAVPAPKNIVSFHSSTASQEDKDAWSAHWASMREVHAYNKLLKQATTEVIGYHPIFEDDLEFIGYTRGRSSVTLQFKAGNGQVIDFGPSGIDALISSIIQKKTDIVDITPSDRSGDPTDALNGIRVRFVFEKKGANIYATTKFKE